MLTSIQRALEQSPDYQKFLQEEAAEEAKKLKRIADEASAPLRKVNAAQRQLFVPMWSKPTPELIKLFNQSHSNPTLLLTMFWNVLLRPTTDRIFQDPNDAERIFQNFIQKTLPSQGWKLNPSGAMRLTTFVAVQIQAGGNEVTPENLQLWFNALQENGCFDDQAAELSYSQPQPQPEPTRVPTVDDFENLNLSSDEGGRQGRRIAEELFGREARPIVQQWIASLLTRFKFDISQEQLNAVKAWMARRNKSALDLNALEDCRRSLVRATIFPPTALDLDDLRAICFEKLETSDKESIRVARFGNREAVEDLMRRKHISIF